MTDDDDHNSITGRDGYIICKALCNAVELFAASGFLDEPSDRRDMELILSRFSSATVYQYRKEARGKIAYLKSVNADPETNGGV